MSTKNNMLTDISAELEKEFGAHGTPEREQFDEEAYLLIFDSKEYTSIRLRSNHSEKPSSRPNETFFKAK